MTITIPIDDAWAFLDCTRSVCTGETYTVALKSAIYAASIELVSHIHGGFQQGAYRIGPRLESVWRWYTCSYFQNPHSVGCYEITI